MPKNVKQGRQLLGLAGYFRKFIPEFDARTACITDLTKKDVPWNWTQEREDARKYVIEKLCQRPLLVVFVSTLVTELHTDASSIGSGGVLFQRHGTDLRVVAYYSKKSTEEKHYHSYELETLAIVNALKHFRVSLLGIRFKIVTDCNAIKATAIKRLIAASCKVVDLLTGLRFRNRIPKRKKFSVRRLFESEPRGTNTMFPLLIKSRGWS